MHRNIPALSVFLCLLAGTLSARPAATLHDFAHIGDGGPIRTTFTVINQNDRNARLEISFFADDGSPLQVTIAEVTATQFEFQVPASGSLRFATSGLAKTPRQGWARMISDLPVGAQAAFEIYLDDQLQTQAAVDTTTPLRSVDFPVDSATGTDTGVAIANLSSVGPLTIQLTLVDSEGNPVSTATFEIPAGGHTARFAAQLFELEDPVRGWINVLGSGPFALTVLQQTDLILGSLPRIISTF